MNLNLAPKWFKKALEDEPQAGGAAAMDPRFSPAELYAPGEGETPRVVIMDQAADEVRRLAAVMAPLETGGVLVGHSYPLQPGEGKPLGMYYVVERALPPPLNSVSRNGEFERGDEGLNEELDLLSGQGLEYLGEWHTHSSGDNTPSQVDDETMRAIALDAGYMCSSPILLIAGAYTRSAPDDERAPYTVTIYPDGERVDLPKVDPS